MNSARSQRILLVTLLILVLTLVGCSRGFYRRQADQDAYALIRSHSDNPRWQLQDYTLQPAPTSRMFDPTDPDCPPMPPDDPTSHRYMECVDCKKGWPCWRCYGNTNTVENPNWRSYLPLDGEGNLVLDRQAAVQMSLLNSRQYQEALESLYLSALDVSFQRFRFDVQFFGGNATTMTSTGKVLNGGSSSNQLSTETSLEGHRLLATGGQLVVGLANSIVWEFSGHDQSTTVSLLNFSLFQPLLRGGGRAVALEALTESERNLLANARQMERFRDSFYTAVLTGRALDRAPAPGGFTINDLDGGGPSGVNGFLGLLQAQVQIRNQRANISGLQTSLQQLAAFGEAGRLERFQVDLARQSLYDAQSNLLTITRNYTDLLDAYKLTLGLPPQLPVRIADPLLERFNLIASELTETLDTVLVLTQAIGDKYIPMPPDYVQQLAALKGRTIQQLELVQQDLQSLDQALPKRRKILEQLATRQEIRAGQVEPGVVDVAVLDTRVGKVLQEYNALQTKMQQTLAAVDQIVQNPPDPASLAPVPREPLPGDQTPPTQAPGMPPAEGTVAPPNVPSGMEAGLPPGLKPDLPAEDDLVKTPREQIAALLTTLAGHLRALSLVQAAARLDTPTLVPIDLESDKALDIARDNRLDWMNARAALVDQWRQIEITANALRSDLNLKVNGDISTVGNNPTRFRGTNGELQVGFEFNAPLTRLQERNNYRAAQIAYQQARRDYYAYEDRVSLGLRRTLRLIQVNQLDFEIRRTAIFNAISQVESAQTRLDQPPRPTAPGAAPAAVQLSPTTARDITQALSGLLSAQNSFLSIWVAYEAERMFLDLDLGTMQLDAHGMWIDPGPVTSESRQPEPLPAAPAPAVDFAAPPVPAAP